VVIRKIGALLRGKATPIQIFLASLLGGLMGFVPDLGHGGGLFVLYLLLLLVLNANVGLAALVALLAKLVAMLVMPATFEVGRWLLDGPLQGLFAAAVNAPVLALLGLEHYATSGGVVVGAVFGVLCGWLLVRSVAGFRAKMAKLESGSDRYAKLTSATWSRLLLWLLVGGRHGKMTYGQMLERQSRNPIRVAGLVVALVVTAVVLVAPSLVSGPVLTAATKDGLQTWNGATVDVGDVQLDLTAGSLVVTDLAMADPNDLGTDLFRAARLEADVRGADLLRKRLAIDRIVVVDGQNGAARASPGELVGPAPAPTPTAGDGDGAPTKTLEDYFADAEAWKERLAQVREWLEQLGDEEAPPAPGEPVPEEEGTLDRIERQVRDRGYAAVVARHLLTEAPSLLVGEILAEGVRSTAVGSDLDLTITNLSTDPELVDEPARLRLTSRDGALDVDLSLDGKAGGGGVSFLLRGVATDRVASSLSVDGRSPVRGGTLDVELVGGWAGGRVGQLDLPLNVRLHGVTVDLPGGERLVDDLVLPFGLSGPIDNPSIRFDADELKDALLAGAKAELEGELDAKRAELDDELAEKESELDEKVEEEKSDMKDEAKKKLGDKLGGLFGDDDDQEE